MTNNMSPEEALLRAAEDQAEHGHCKEKFYQASYGDAAWEAAPACAYGSLSRVLGLTTTGSIASEHFDGTTSTLARASAKLGASIRRLNPDHPIVKSHPTSDVYNLITFFNDHSSTTGEDVILAMKTAAHDG